MLNKIISANQEFQGRWEEDVRSVWWFPEYEKFNEEFIDIEIASERMKMKVLLIRLAVVELNLKGIQPNSEKSNQIMNKYEGIMSDVSFSNHLTREEGEKPLNNSLYTESWDIVQRTRLASNYSYPIMDKIVNEVEGGYAYRIPHNLEKINEALTLYLRSKIRDNEIDRLFLKLLSDCEIIASIEKFGMSKYFPSGNSLWSRIRKRKDLIEEEEFWLSFHKNALSGILHLKLFVWFLGISIFTIFASHFYFFIPNSLGFIVTLVLIIFWLWTNKSSKKRAKNVLNNFETSFPTLNFVEKMEGFYFLIRAPSPLPVSKIKKDLKIWEGCPGFKVSIPDGIKSLIMDLEKRGIKYI